MDLVEIGCFGEPYQTFGNIPQGLNQGGDLQYFVPDNEVWEVHALGAGQTNAGTYSGLICDMHIEYKYSSDPNDLGVHVFPLYGMHKVLEVNGVCPTPFIALERRVILMPRMRLGVRFASPPQGLQVSLMGYGFRYPLSDLPRLLFQSGGESSVSTPPDFTALEQAAVAAEAALATAAQSLQQFSTALP